MERDQAVGYYLVPPDNSTKVTTEVRLYMVTVIIEVHRIKGFREETLYLAVSLADRFLA